MKCRPGIPVPVVSLIAALYLFCLSIVFCGAQTINDPNLQYRVIASVNAIATNMAFIADGDILVLKKNTGEVVRVLNGNFVGPVLDVHVNSFNGRGLLGITLHPNFPANGFVYLYYTKSTINGDVATNESILENRVERYKWNGVALVNPTFIASLPADAQGVHVGGIMTFGPDGKLYIEIGYNDRDGKLQNNISGADPDDTGVILRLNDDGSIPPDNPFFGQGGNLRKYFAYGIRNSFGMAFDPLSGKLWMTDNGDENYDEINIVLPGFNSGWAKLMGPSSRAPGATADLYAVPGSHYADPKFSWFDSVAPTAILFFNSPQLGAQYLNNAFVSDYNAGRIYRFRLNAERDGFVFQFPGLEDLVADDDTEVSEVLFGSGLGLLTDLKVGPDGKLYLLRLDGTLAVIERKLAANPGLAIMAFDPTASGFDIDFNKAVDVSLLNLYDIESRLFGPVDVALVGTAIGLVRGSLMVDASARAITFVKTGGVLDPDTYTVTLRSDADAFKDTDGNLLDGDGDGDPGGDYVTTFVVNPSNSVVISMPDFSYGPGQAVNVPFNRVGIPVNLSNGSGITALDFTVVYDPLLLTFSGVDRGDSLPADAIGLELDVSRPGAMRVSFIFPTPLALGPVEVLRLTGFVPNIATYKAANLITFETVVFNSQAIAAVADDAVHIVAYLGDTTGNGAYSSLDAQRVLRVAAGLDSGFTAYPLIDPVLIADTTWSGSISALDATRILQEAAGLDRPEIPPIPQK